MDLSSALSGIIGAIIGAILTLFGTVWSQRKADRNSRKSLVTNYQVGEYLSILDTSFEVLDAFETFGRALSGRKEPGPDSTEDEIEEARQRDEASCEALDRLYIALNMLAQKSLRVSAIGAGEIKEAADEARTSVNIYMSNAVKQAIEDRRFIAADYAAESEHLQQSIYNLVEKIRSYLEIDTLFSDSSRCRNIAEKISSHLKTGILFSKSSCCDYTK